MPFTDVFRTTVLNSAFPNTTWYETFEDVVSDSDFWDYMITVVPTFLFQDNLNDRDDVYQVNRMVQPARIRQIRVIKETPSTCTIPIPARLRKFITVCFPAAGPGVSSTAAIPGWPPGEPLQYRTAAELNTARSWLGIFPYSGDGFAYDFPLNATQADVLARLNYWRQMRWTDRQTRAVFLNFVVYNPENRFYISATLLFEFLPNGRVNPVHSFRVMRLGLTDTADYALLALDSVVFVGFLLLALREMIQLYRLGPRNYTHDPWRAVNWVIFAIFIITLVFKFQFLLPAFSIASGAPAVNTTGDFIDFEALGWTNSQLWNWTSFHSVLLWLKALGYVRLTTDSVAGQLHSVLGTARRSGAAFALLSILVLAFGIALYQAFGVDLANLSTVTVTCEVLWQSYHRQQLLELICYNL